MSDQHPPPGPPPQEPPYAAQPSGSQAVPPYGAQPPAAPPVGQSAAQPQYAPYTGTPATAQKAPVLSIISLILGIIGVLGGAVAFIPIVGWILQLFIPGAAVVLGFLGKKNEPQAPKGLWLTGIILGFVGLAFILVGILIFVAALATSNTTSP